jgi:hypothetical protein
LAEIAPGNFGGHYCVARRQKAWFLPAASVQGACGASDGNTYCLNQCLQQHGCWR